MSTHNSDMKPLPLSLIWGLHLNKPAKGKYIQEALELEASAAPTTSGKIDKGMSQ